MERPTNLWKRKVSFPVASKLSALRRVSAGLVGPRLVSSFQRRFHLMMITAAFVDASCRGISMPTGDLYARRETPENV
jgi:hypothetical protein